MSTPVPRIPAAAAVVVHAAEDMVWAQWLRQVAAEIGVPARLRSFGYADEPEAAADQVIVLVISDHLVRAAARDRQVWAAADQAGAVLAVIVGSGTVPPELAGIPAVDLRVSPEAQARAKVLAALGQPDGPPAGETLARAQWPPVRYPGRQLAGEYRSKSLPRHQAEWFYGRHAEIDAIRTRLENSRAAVLAGAPGTGKSWLAAAYANHFRSQYDLIAWIPGENGARIREELCKLAEPLDIPVSGSRDTLHLDVVEALCTTDLRYLIIYDNVSPDHHDKAGELPLPRKRALLEDVVPWRGRGHVLLTSKAADWDVPQAIPVRAFTAEEGADFLRRHVDQLDTDLARRFSTALDGSPVLLNTLARRGSRGTEEVDEGLLETLSKAPLRVVAGESTYKQTHAIYGDSLRPLVGAPQGSDLWAAGALLRLLTLFPPGQPIPLAVLTSELAAGTRAPGSGLPADLARALTIENRRRAVLDFATRDSVAQLCADPLSDKGRALIVHTVAWHGIRESLPRHFIAENQHLTHHLLGDADPRRADAPAWWDRYLWLWQQTAHTGVLACARVADPGDPCARLPELIRNIIGALRSRGECTAAIGLGVAAIERWLPVLGEEHIGLVRIRIVVGHTLWQVARWEEARAQATAARAGVLQRRAEFPEEYAWASGLLAAALRMAGDWAEAAVADESAYLWARERLGDGHVETVRARHNLAVSYRMLGRFEDALTLDAANYEQMRADPELSGDTILTLHCLNNVARDHRELGAYAESVAVQEEVMRAFTELVPDPLQQHQLRGRKNLAVSYRKAGRFQLALETQRAALTDHVRVYGPDHPESIAARINLANDYRMTGNLDAALTHAEEAHSRCAAVRPDHPYTAACAVDYAAALRRADRPADALSLDQEAVDIFTRRLTADHPYTLAAQSGRASDLAALGRLDEALALGADTLDRVRRVRGANHPYTLQCAVNYTLDLLAADRTAEAEDLERDTLQRYAQTLGPDHPDTQAALARRRGACDVEPPPM
ncbi:FxSxx-COOH system tetratricopeptide repeat protein [Nocardia sp. XZ_19_385]|uniref:FxSxx-COOH system tetratricopeptide repeat protein n=1 Tax=Nocardia sp. XZ_19_385 TaxID=2769488 RepID=UPI00188FDF53|nr:FxSxx-COOH system tetratricopeptide repeat protein [Nocardia sp. XZ_19_385]